MAEKLASCRGALIVLACGLSGCFMPLGVAYPTLSYTPSVPISDDAVKDLHAFRVEFAESPHAKKPADRMQCRFSEIDLASKNSVPRQTTTGVSYYWALFFLPGSGEPSLNSAHSRDEWMRVRLYRQGFKTVEIGPEYSRSMPKTVLVFAPSTSSVWRM